MKELVEVVEKVVDADGCKARTRHACELAVVADEGCEALATAVDDVEPLMDYLACVRIVGRRVHTFAESAGEGDYGRDGVHDFVGEHPDELLPCLGFGVLYGCVYVAYGDDELFASVEFHAYG